MHILFILFSQSSPAFAQWQSSSWLHVGGVYTQASIKEDAGPALTAARAGAQGEVGINLLRFVAFSAAGTYHDGAGTVGDSTATHFAGYASDTRALVHVIYAPLVLSTGLGGSERFETLPGLYRARTSVSYKPMMLSLHLGNAYIRLEQDLGAKGSITRTYADAGGGRTNVRFDLPKTRGQGARIGLMLPSTKYATHLYLDYHRWRTDASAAANNGVGDVVAGSTVNTELTVGLGLAF